MILHETRVSPLFQTPCGYDVTRNVDVFRISVYGPSRTQQGAVPRNWESDAQSLEKLQKVRTRQCWLS